VWVPRNFADHIYEGRAGLGQGRGMGGRFYEAEEHVKDRIVRAESCWPEVRRLRNPVFRQAVQGREAHSAAGLQEQPRGCRFKSYAEVGRAALTSTLAGMIERAPISARC